MKIAMLTVDALTRIQKIRMYLRPEFTYISDQELVNAIRCFSNVKNQIKKDFELHTQYMGLRNKIILLNNIFDTAFIKKKLRREVGQDYHARLNALLLICGVVKDFKSVPVDLEYFKRLMRSNA